MYLKKNTFVHRQIELIVQTTNIITLIRHLYNIIQSIRDNSKLEYILIFSLI